LYEKFGFIENDLTAVMQRRDGLKDQSENTIDLNCRKSEVSDLPRLFAFDMPHFGADRSQLLLSYFDDDPIRFLVSYNQKGEVDGFLVGQKRVIGPWVASSVEVAERLLLKALEFSFDENPTVFVSVSNEAALQLLFRYGFEKQRTQRRMYKGKPIERNRKGSIYGQANFSFG
jgi:ribosomal protein S18 acetylase RimI-like enzyme